MAKFTEVDLVQLSQISADSETPLVPLPTLTMIAVGVKITAFSGTTPTLAFFLQVSDDGGDTWYDLPYDQRVESSSSGADPTVSINKRNIANQETLTAAPYYYLAVYKHLPARDVRGKWFIGGSGSPTVTFKAALVGK